MSDQNDVVIEESTEDGDEGTAEQKLKKLRDEMKEAKKTASENLAGWQRAKADYINLERRMRSMGDELSKGAARNVALGFIPVLDSLEAAVAGNPGLGAILKQADESLKVHGITRYVPRPGEGFDPARHESVQVLATETKEEDNTVSETFQSGYVLEEVTIRPARVSVRYYQSERKMES
jgi:molecular chaperone GrpE